MTNFKPTYENPLGTQRCIFSYKENLKGQCSKTSMVGQVFCQTHLNQTKRNTEKEVTRMEDIHEIARQRMLEYAVEAIDVQRDIMHHGEKDADRLKASQNMIQNSGIAAAQKVEVELNYGETAAVTLVERLNLLRERNSDVLELEEALEDDDTIIIISEEIG